MDNFNIDGALFHSPVTNYIFAVIWQVYMQQKVSCLFCRNKQFCDAQLQYCSS